MNKKVKISDRPTHFENMLDFLKSLGGISVKDIIEPCELEPELAKTLYNIEKSKLKKDAEEPTVSNKTVTKKKETKNEFKSKYETKTKAIEEMTPEKLERMTETLKGNDRIHE